MVKNFLSFFLELPFKFVAGIFDFIVWELFSSQQWKKRRQYGKNREYYFLDEIEGLKAQLLQREREHRREVDDLNRKHRQELNAERRKIQRNYSGVV